MSRRKHGRSCGRSSGDIELLFVCARFADDGGLKVMSGLHPVVESELTGEEMTALSVSVKAAIGVIARAFARQTDRHCGTSFSGSEPVYSMFDPM